MSGILKEPLLSGYEPPFSASRDVTSCPDDVAFSPNKGVRDEHELK